jgi:hypothetical protein
MFLEGPLMIIHRQLIKIINRLLDKREVDVF